MDFCLHMSDFIRHFIRYDTLDFSVGNYVPTTHFVVAMMFSPIFGLGYVPTFFYMSGFIMSISSHIELLPFMYFFVLYIFLAYM